MYPGSLNTRWYAQLGIPAFAYEAGRLDVSHGPEEFIERPRWADATRSTRFTGEVLW